MQHLKRKNEENKLNSKKSLINKSVQKPLAKTNKPPQKSTAKINKPNQKPLTKDNKSVQKTTPKINKLEPSKVPTKTNPPQKVSVNVNKSVQKPLENNHSINPINQPFINQNNFNELKTKLDSIKSNISTDNGSIITGKLTANEIFIKNNENYIHEEWFCYLLSSVFKSMSNSWFIRVSYYTFFSSCI